MMGGWNLVCKETTFWHLKTAPRGYLEQILKAAFNRLEKVTRSEALVKVNRKRGGNTIVTLPLISQNRCINIMTWLNKTLICESNSSLSNSSI